MYDIEAAERQDRLVLRLIVTTIITALICGAVCGYTLRGWGGASVAAVPAAQAPALTVDCDRPPMGGGSYSCQVMDAYSGVMRAAADCIAPTDMSQNFSCTLPAIRQGVAVSTSSACSPLEVRAWTTGLTVASGTCDADLRRALIETVAA